MDPKDLEFELMVNDITKRMRALTEAFQNAMDAFARLQVYYIKALVRHGLTRDEAIALASVWHPLAADAVPPQMPPDEKEPHE